MIAEIVRILEGDTEALRREAQARMEDASRSLRFEDAARERDVLKGLDSIAREQRMESAKGWSRDVLGVARDGTLAAAVVLRVRKGKLIGRESHRFSGLGDETDEDLLGAFTSLYYLGRGANVEGELPREILLPTAIPDQGVLEEVLSERRGGRRVRFHVPARGEKRRMTDLAAANARHLLEERVTALEVASDRADSVLYELQDRLDLMVVPRLIACFDISHTQGSELVASVVTFENGVPKRSQYRHMRIRGEWTNDDFRSMAEVVERYVSRKLREGEPLPELLLLDGGKGQLSAVRPVLAALGAGEIALAALAKRNEEIYVPGRNEPVRLSRRDPALRLLQRIRNEAHRVAIGYNRKLRGRRTLRSELSDIPGIGPERQRALLSHFGSVRRVREATPEEIAEAPGFSKALGERVINHLRAPG